MVKKEVSPFSVLYNVGSHKKQMNVIERKGTITINGKVLKTKKHTFKDIKKSEGRAIIK
ncbi:Uncharacterised protein [[Clostridium] sordellii]|uniref:hypothetical protein n=1 Tax=Paraclostridium sordellii TaxID=1505 RepID=UPI0005E487B5|nr:hypothetical protein [Paeniclostridium sordellii]CEQ29998.1 Uncharacterised protein [[Clostridium] sordellii] [Paeniclostridium sordellii]